MWCGPYSLTVLGGGLALTFLVTASFGSHLIEQDDKAAPVGTRTINYDEIMQQQPKRIPTIISTEQGLPSDVRVYIVSSLQDQEDLLRIGAVSKSWRKAAAKVWEKRWLDLSNKPLTAGHYTTLAKGIFPRLRLNKVEINEEGMNILATCSHLQALELRGNNLHATESLIKPLSLSHLSYIDPYNSIDDEGAKAITGLLTQNTTLTMIDLRDNRISTEGAKAIAAALKENKTLTTVCLDNNMITVKGAKAIAAALHKNKTLITVALNSNYVGDGGAKAIAEAMKQNKTLTRLELGNNIISDEGGKAIAAAIKENKTLTTVNLGWNRMGNQGTKAIMMALHNNTTLTTINLESNVIGNKGATTIAAAFRVNMTLTTVDLSSNQIRDEGTKAIAEALAQNTTLTTVYLSDNTIGAEGKQALENLKRSRSSLNLRY